MNPLTLQKIRNNWEIARKSISTYIVAAITAGGAWWLGMSQLEQVAWLTAHPTLAPIIPYAPWISGALWVIFRLWPQFFPRPTTEIKDAKSIELDAMVKRLEEMGFKIPDGAAPIAAAPAAPNSTTVVVNQPAALVAAPPPPPPPPPPAPRIPLDPVEQALWDALKRQRALRSAPPIDHPLP